jgi:hypothetical protein
MLTFRRYYVDTLLSATDFSGRVLDIGGKKEKKRGQFRPHLDQVEKWEYLNINPETYYTAVSTPFSRRVLPLA